MSNTKNKFFRLAQMPPIPGAPPPPMPGAPPTAPMAGGAPPPAPAAPPTDPQITPPLDSMPKILAYAGAGAGGQTDLLVDKPKTSPIALGSEIWEKFGGDKLGNVDPSKTGTASYDDPNPQPVKPYIQNDTPWTLLPIGKTIQDITSLDELSTALNSMPIPQSAAAKAQAGGAPPGGGGGGGAPSGGGGAPPSGPPPGGGGAPPGGPPPGLASAIHARIILANRAEEVGLYRFADCVDKDLARMIRESSTLWGGLASDAMKAVIEVQEKARKEHDPLLKQMYQNSAKMYLQMIKDYSDHDDIEPSQFKRPQSDLALEIARYMQPDEAGVYHKELGQLHSPDAAPLLEEPQKTPTY